MSTLSRAELEHISDEWQEDYPSFMDAVFAVLDRKDDEGFHPQYDALVYIDVDEFDAAKALVEDMVAFANASGSELVAVAYVDSHDDKDATAEDPPEGLEERVS